jgi:DNA-binding NarL/FixJ family response regulator
MIRSVIVDRLGHENAQRLADVAGGTRLSVPAQLANGARLRLLLGNDLATLVILHFGGLGRVYVPTMKLSPKVDARTVRRLSKRGWSASRIARELGCSERTVHTHRAPKRKTRKD